MAIPEAEGCESTLIHTDAVEKVRSRLPENDIISSCAELYKVFGDMTRLKILFSLLQSELCVCDIAALLDISQSGVSHQLRVLKQANLVKSRRDGKVVYYSPADSHIRTLIEQALEHVLE